MSNSSPDLSRWSSITAHISRHIDLETSARASGALLRRRGVPSAAALLQLALLHGPGGMSLRSTASFALEAGIANVCDVSLLDRLRNCGDWLTCILNELLAPKRDRAALAGGLRLALVDGSTVSIPGSKGSDWRLHARYEPGLGAFTDLQITAAKQAEALDRVSVLPGDLVVHDRGYGRARHFVHAMENGAHFISRIGWRALKLVDHSGAPFDLIAALPEEGPEIVEISVAIAHNKKQIPIRLVIARKSPEAREHESTRRQRKARKSKQVVNPSTLKAAGFMICATSLPQSEATSEAVIQLYRLRWQIELAFKRLKSLGGYAELRASDPKLVRTWLLAHLIAAVLIETCVTQDLDSPP